MLLAYFLDLLDYLILLPGYIPEFRYSFILILIAQFYARNTYTVTALACAGNTAFPWSSSVTFISLFPTTTISRCPFFCPISIVNPAALPVLSSTAQPVFLSSVPWRVHPIRKGDSKWSL